MRTLYRAADGGLYRNEQCGPFVCCVTEPQVGDCGPCNLVRTMTATGWDVICPDVIPPSFVLLGDDATGDCIYSYDSPVIINCEGEHQGLPWEVTLQAVIRAISSIFDRDIQMTVQLQYVVTGNTPPDLGNCVPPPPTLLPTANYLYDFTGIDGCDNIVADLSNDNFAQLQSTNGTNICGTWPNQIEFTIR